MRAVEQAIFGLLAGDHTAGYRVVARSGGVCDADAGELAVWGPTHDAMLAFSRDAESLNFHPLPSGAFCVSLTTWIDWDRSGMGQAVSTRCLVVPREVLAHFGNSPFALLRAATASEAWQLDDPPDAKLGPLAVGGGAAAVDGPLLEQLAIFPGADNMAELVQAACEATCLAVSGDPSPTQLIAGLFSCLPPECRLHFSFSTGLKFSPRRPFRIVALSGDPAERQWVAHHPNVAVLNVCGSELPSPAPLDGWARLIERTLAGGRIDFLSAQASKRRFQLKPRTCQRWVFSCSRNWTPRARQRRGPRSGAAAAVAGPQPASPRAHHRFAARPQAVSTTAAPIAAPSAQLDPNVPEVLERLELLDDLVYEAISGHADAMERLREEWPKIAARLGDALLGESLEQYLRYAMSVWDECSDADGARDPARAIQALDVLSLLFDSVA